MLDVGFNDANTFISSPLEMPPKIPPELFDSKPDLLILSLFSEPFIVTTLQPVPISTAFTAFTLIIAFANSASNFEKTGEPIPDGMPEIFINIFAPIESCSLFNFAKNSFNSSTFAPSRKLNSLLVSKLISSAFISPT